MFNSILPSFEGFDMAAKFGAKSQGGEEMAAKGFHMEDYVQVGNEPMMFAKATADPQGLEQFLAWKAKLIKADGNITVGDQTVPVNTPVGQEALLKAQLQIEYGFDPNVAQKAAHDLIFGAGKAGSKSAMGDDPSGAKSKANDHNNQGSRDGGQGGGRNGGNEGQGKVKSSEDARVGSNAAAKGKSAQDSNSNDGNHGDRGLGNRTRGFHGNNGQRFQPRGR